MTKRFNEQEVRLILRRAVTPIQDEHDPDIDDRGVTLEELKEIAVEVGIDPLRVQLAATELRSSVSSPTNPYLGIPTTVHFESVIRGIRLEQLLEHDLVSLIRSIMGRQGIVSRQGSAFEWKARDPMGGRYVSLTPTEDGIRVSVLGNYRDGVLSIAAGVGGPIFVGASAVLSSLALGPAGILLGGAVLAALPPRFAYRAWRKKEDATLATLHRRLLEAVGQAALHEPGELEDPNTRETRPLPSGEEGEEPRASRED